MMVLAAIGRCVSPDLCPTDEQLLTAVRDLDARTVLALSDKAARDRPDEIVMFHSQRIKRISDTLCSERLPTDLPGDPVIINCKFTVRYWNKDSFNVARLVKNGAGWTIETALAVNRDRG